jgi:hypothetical protein
LIIDYQHFYLTDRLVHIQLPVVSALLPDQSLWQQES